MTGKGGRKGPRTLSPEERLLWERVAATADPLMREMQMRDDAGPPKPMSAPERPAPPRPASRAAPASGPSVTFSIADAEIGPVGHHEPGLDRRTSGRLRKGVREPEARIDLHGMTAERAHRACLTFLSDALAHGLRVVLVITGKGGRGADAIMGTGRGVLRESLPGWLRASGLGRSIVGIYEAHPRHGGAGAFYVYLKRRR